MVPGIKLLNYPGLYEEEEKLHGINILMTLLEELLKVTYTEGTIN